MWDYTFRPIPGHPEVHNWSLKISKKKYIFNYINVDVIFIFNNPNG
jgi:hypothetical protein